MDNVVQIFDKVLAKAREVGASDIHLCTGVLWKYRVLGRVVPITALNPLKKDEAEAIVRHVMTAAGTLVRGDIDNQIRCLTDLDLSYSLPGVSRFRVNICRQRGTFSLVLRLIPVDCPSPLSSGDHKHGDGQIDGNESRRFRAEPQVRVVPYPRSSLLIVRRTPQLRPLPSPPELRLETGALAG